MLDLYKNIRRLRLENGWSQNDLAKRAGYKDRSAIAHVEDGTVDLPQSKIMLFANIFGVSPAQLFGGSSANELTGDSYTTEEAAVIAAYRNADETRKDVVCDVLHITRPSAAKEKTGLPKSSSSRNVG